MNITTEKENNGNNNNTALEQSDNNFVLDEGEDMDKKLMAIYYPEGSTPIITEPDSLEEEGNRQPVTKKRTRRRKKDISKKIHDFLDSIGPKDVFSYVCVAKKLGVQKGTVLKIREFLKYSKIVDSYFIEDILNYTNNIAQDGTCFSLCIKDWLIKNGKYNWLKYNDPKPISISNIGSKMCRLGVKVNYISDKKQNAYYLFNDLKNISNNNLALMTDDLNDSNTLEHIDCDDQKASDTIEQLGYDNIEKLIIDLEARKKEAEIVIKKYEADIVRYRNIALEDIKKQMEILNEKEKRLTNIVYA